MVYINVELMCGGGFVEYLAVIRIIFSCMTGYIILEFCAYNALNQTLRQPVLASSNYTHSITDAPII
jgi:hypothetical protein